MDNVERIDGHHVHCRQCITEGRRASTEVLMDGKQIQVWCLNHARNVARLELKYPLEIECHGTNHDG